MPEPLFGRLAVHYKLITMDQLNTLTTLQARSGGKQKLGELMVERKLISANQLDKLIAAQRDYVAKYRQQSQPRAQTEQRSPRPFTIKSAKSNQDLAVIDRCICEAMNRRASDIHFHAGGPLNLRRMSKLETDKATSISSKTIHGALQEILSDTEKEALDQDGEVDFAYALEGVGRFRANAYRQHHGYSVVFHFVASAPPTLNELGLPMELARFTNDHQGLVLITGPSGSGKSSTMAALINIINEERRDHVISIEDPIEFVHPSKRCVINQRQVGPHTSTFDRALRAALREDPDVIALGELRDFETISLALTAAETGHLVFATLHTANAVQTINRIIGVFPPSRQTQIRNMVSESLRTVISQRLVARADGDGQVAAIEVLVNTKAVGKTIRDRKTIQLRSALQTGRAHGMQLLDASLASLVRSNTITREEALRHADDPKSFAA